MGHFLSCVTVFGSSSAYLDKPNTEKIWWGTAVFQLLLLTHILRTSALAFSKDLN